jgi:hypothetical protein
VYVLISVGEAFILLHLHPVEENRIQINLNVGVLASASLIAVYDVIFAPPSLFIFGFQAERNRKYDLHVSFLQR